MLTAFFRTMKDDTSGATAVEYGLIISLIVVTMLVGVRSFANETLEIWDFVETETVEALN